MKADHEMTRYLRLLLEHSNQCDDETCPSHARLHEICSILRERIFSGPVTAGGPANSLIPLAPSRLRDVHFRAAIGKP